jgi:hypothetical protein
MSKCNKYRKCQSDKLGNIKSMEIEILIPYLKFDIGEIDIQ